MICRIWKSAVRPPHLELRVGVRGWHVAIVGANGETMMHSEDYHDRGSADRAARRLAKETHWKVIEKANRNP